MKPSRLEELYRRKLARAEESPKQLPLERILNKQTTVFPETGQVDRNDIIEIGPGTGDFLFFIAEQFPQKKILGIEIDAQRFYKIKARIIKKGLKNITLLHGDARIPFHKNISDNTIEKCFVLFPDPWPKNRHRHLRLLQTDFIKLVCQKLGTGGEFTLGTDVRDYAFWVLDNFKQFPQMANVFGEGQILPELADIPHTFFQKKWNELGRNFFFLRFKKLG
ncbi:MAG: tRNA (guanosine(46)-N7)-methyltransferase TrmB [Deltaproteobacteria bacterium]|nr:tRNA (guanosine(46)-N7)-methyltransferase TrmB [Deltaproteobacteria bacterium]